jgi:hypothetical protein
MATDKKTQIKEENTLLKLQQETAAEYNLTLERTVQLQERIAEKIERANKAGKDLDTVYSDILGSMEEMTARVAQMDKQEAKRLKLAKQSMDIQDSLNDLSQDLGKALKMATSLTEDDIIARKQNLDLLQRQIIAAKKSGALSEEQAKEYSNLTRELQENVKEAERFQQAIGPEDAAQLGESFKKAGSFVNTMTGGLVSAEKIQDALLEMTERLGPGFAAALGPIGLIVGAISKVMALIGEVNAQTREFSNQTGTSFQQSEKLVESSMRLAGSSDNIMSSQKEILAVQGSLVKQFGTVDAVSDKTVQNLSNMSKVLGYSEETAAGVQAVFMQNAGASEDAAAGVQQMTANLAEAYGVPIGEVMKDLAESGEEVAKYFNGMPGAAGKAAVELKAMGLNLQTAGKMADGLLDIEASLKAETKAQVMLGKAINLDKARQLAAEGKIADAAKAATEEIGDAASFAKMDQFQKKAAADAAGLTVEQLSKAYALQERTKGMSKEQADLISQYGDSLGDVTQMNDEQLKQKVTDLQNQEKLGVLVENLKTVFTNAILPVMKAIAVIVDVGFVQPISYVVGLFQQMYNYMSQNLDVFTIFASTFLLVLGYMNAAMIIEKTRLGIQYAVNAAQLIYQGYLTVANAIAMEGLLPYIARMAMAAFSSIASIPIVGPFIAPAAAAGALAYGYSLMKADDAVIPPAGEGGPGYSRVLSGPEGSIALNDKDSIIAGTDLGGGGGGAAPSGGGMDIGPLVAAIQQTNALLSQMASSPPPVLIGDEALRKIGRNVKVQNSRGS